MKKELKKTTSVSSEGKVASAGLDDLFYAASLEEHPETYLEEYQNFVDDCPHPNFSKPIEPGYWGATQMMSEAGEVLELFEKSYRKNLPLDKEKVLDECGDTLWGIAFILNSIGATIDEALEYNMIKLTKRIYGDEAAK